MNLIQTALANLKNKQADGRFGLVRNKIAQTLLPATSFFKPTSNSGPNFWSTPAAQGLARVQGAVQPTVNFFSGGNEYRSQAINRTFPTSIPNAPRAVNAVAKLNVVPRTIGSYLFANQPSQKEINSPQYAMDLAINMSGGLNNVRGVFPTAPIKQAVTPQATKQILSTINPKGLLNESYAQTAFRRASNLNPTEVYTPGVRQKVADFVKGAFGRNDPRAIERIQDSVDSSFTPVLKKVGIFDYFKTPDTVLKKIGLEPQAKQLRASYENYLTQLPEEITKIQSWMKRVPGPESSNKIFNYLDGKNVFLNPAETEVAGEIKTYLKLWANRLGLPEERRVTNYITHIFEKGTVEAEFNDEIAKLIDQQVAGSVYNPFKEARKKNDLPYIQDVWRALDAYAKRAVRSYNMDPALKVLKDASDSLELSQAKYLERLTSRINLRPTEIDTLIDNFVKSSPVGYRLGQRPTATVTRAVRQQIYRGALGLNVSSAVRNLSQASNTYAKLGERYTLTGYLKMAANWNSDELIRVGVLRDSFIEDQTLSVYKRLANTVDKGLFALFEAAEKINRGSAYYGAKAQALAKGMDETEAINYAKEIVRKTQFTFGSIDTPVAMQSDLVKTISQFQTFGVKQIEFLADMIKNKEYLGLIRYLGSTFVIMQVLKNQLGIKLDILPQFGLSPTVQALTNIGPAIYGDDQRKAEARKKLLGTAATLIPAGVQGKKTITGLSDYLSGHAQTPAGNVRYNIDQTTPNLIKSALFGSSATPEGQSYFQNYGVSKSEQFYNSIKNKSPQEKAKAAAQLKASNPAMYRALVSYMNDKQVKITSREKQIRGLNINDGSRARAVVAQLKKQRTAQGKAELYKRYVHLGILNETVRKQVEAAIRAGVLK